MCPLGNHFSRTSKQELYQTTAYVRNRNRSAVAALYDPSPKDGFGSQGERRYKAKIRSVFERLMIRAAHLNLPEHLLQEPVPGAAEEVRAAHPPLLKVFVRIEEPRKRLHVARQ